MNRALRLIIVACVTFIIVKASTFGWRWVSKSLMNFAEDKQLAQRLKSHVYKLAEEIGERSVYKYEQLEETARYIIEQFSSFGYPVEFQNYTLLTKSVKNIIATKIGEERPQEIIVVGAHYDSCFNPGADDNASAVAGLIELARALVNKQTNCSIKFIAFVNEEPPFFQTEDMGSRVYTRAAKTKGEDIKAALILEMIGYYSNKPFSQRYPPILGLFYPNQGNFICAVGNYPSFSLMKQVVRDFRQQTKFSIFAVPTFGLIPGADFSDHWSFWQEGYPAVMITDTAFYRNPHYHTNTDTYEKLDYLSMAEVVKGLQAVLVELAR